MRLHVSIGILKTTTSDVMQAISVLERHLRHPACVGITVCAAKGAELSQAELIAGLSEVLALGIPTSLYQLPQVTLNELQPETVQTLIKRFQNIILFKDTAAKIVWLTPESTPMESLLFEAPSGVPIAVG